MDNTTTIPKHLMQMNKTLNGALKQMLAEYNVGAFAGIKRFEMIEILRSLPSFYRIMDQDAFRYVLYAVTDAISRVITESVMTKLREQSASTDPINRYATKERVGRQITLAIIELPVKEPEEETPVVRMALIRNTDFFMSRNMFTDTGVVDLAALDENALNLFKAQVFRCDQITVTDLEALVNVETARIANTIIQTCCHGCGQLLSTKRFTPETTAFDCLQHYIKNSGKLQTYTEAKTDDVIEALAQDFSPVFATAMIHLTVTNGIKQEVAEEMINSVNYKFTWSHEKGKTPTFMIIMTTGANAFAKSAKFTDMIATIKDVYDTKRKALSNASLRICKLLLDASAMYTTAILANSLPDDYMMPIYTETDSEDASQSNET